MHYCFSILKGTLNTIILYLSGRCYLALDWSSKTKEMYYNDQLAEVRLLLLFTPLLPFPSLQSSYVRTYLPTYLPTYLLLCILSSFIASLSAFVHSPSHLPSFLPSFFPLSKDLRYKRQLARLRCHSFVISSARDKSS